MTVNGTKNITRNLNIEILRIIAMFLIVACHGIIHIDWFAHHLRLGLDPKPGWSNAIKFVIVQYGQVGVVLFFIISGYFLCTKKFSWKRLINSYKQMWIYSFLCLIAFSAVYASTHADIFAPLFTNKTSIVQTIFSSIFPFMSNSYWFMTAYIFMLLLMPFLNTLIQQLKGRQLYTLIALLMLMGSTVLLFGRNNNWSSATYAVLGYCIGAAMKLYPEYLNKLITPITSVIGVLGITTLMCIFNYATTVSSPLIIIMGWQTQTHSGILMGPVLIASIIFYCATVLCPQIHISGRPQKALLAISKSTFGVYLLHENLFGFRIFWEVVSRIIPTPSSRLLAVPEFLLIIVCSFIILAIAAFCIDKLIADRITFKKFN